jgi:hypothetical protein
MTTRPFHLVIFEYASLWQIARKETLDRIHCPAAVNNELLALRPPLLGVPALEGSPAPNKINNQDDYRDHQQQMNQSAANMSKQAEKPEN